MFMLIERSMRRKWGGGIQERGHNSFPREHR